MKNKTHKYRQFKEFTNTFDADRSPEDWQQVFGNANPLTLELGCGKADFSLELARRFPERNFVGVDIKSDRLWRPARTALSENLTNIAFLRTHLLRLPDFFAPNSIVEMWITFPDPYPKKRQAKHRMVTKPFLAVYQSLLAPNGSMHLKTDDLALFHYTLEQLAACKVRLLALSFDLHESNLAAEAKVRTDFERRWLAQGKQINYVSWQFVAAPVPTGQGRRRS